MTSRLRVFADFSVHEKADIGDTKISMKGSDHTGWLLCNGRSLNIYEYNLLYQVVGTNYGGSGLAFNLPNPKGRVLGVIGSGPGLTSRNQSDTVGEETHTLNEAELPVVTHNTSDNGSHTHTHNANGGSPGYGLMYRDGNNTAGDGLDTSATEPNLYQSPGALTVNAAGTHHHSYTFGSGDSHNNMQPTMFVGNMFIYCGRPNAGTYPYTFKGYNYYKNPGT